MVLFHMALVVIWMLSTLRKLLLQTHESFRIDEESSPDDLVTLWKIIWASSENGTSCQERYIDNHPYFWTNIFKVAKMVNLIFADKHY